MPFFLVNKPQGYTSYDIVEKFKRLFFSEKVWHSWTLDPMATWLLIIAVWRVSTKHLWKLLKLDKTYIAEIDFSILTDTWDMDFFKKMEKYDFEFLSSKNEKIFLKKEEKNGKEICYYKIFFKKPKPSLEEIKSKLDLLIPKAVLPLTMFSAKKIKWKKLYELAREGIDLKLEKEMKVNSYKILNYAFPKLTLRLNVWSWTYIRSIGYWLGKQFDLWWTLTKLHRESIWNISLRLDKR